MKTTMGEKIKDLRVERHMTTNQLAQATGISEAVINGLENDNGRDVGYSRIIELASFFNVPTDSCWALQIVVSRKILNLNSLV